MDLQTHPIERNSAAYDRAVGGLTLGVLAWPAAMFLLAGIADLLWIGLNWGGGIMAVTGAALGVGAYVSRGRKPAENLLLNESGIHFTRKGAPIDLSWNEIVGTSEAVTLRNARGEALITVVQIEVSGRQTRGELIDPARFGFTNEQFVDLVSGGVARWGSAETKPWSHT